MNEINTDILAGLAIRALERTAFILAEPTAQDAGASDDATRSASIRYTGPGSGIVAVRASAEFVRQLAASLLGVEASEIDPNIQGDDALRELTNVLGGSVITHLGGDQCRYSLGLPQSGTGKTGSPAAPDGASAECCLDCEGQALFVSWHSDAVATSRAA